jgi:hypothetical protein
MGVTRRALWEKVDAGALADRTLVFCCSHGPVPSLQTSGKGNGPEDIITDLQFQTPVNLYIDFFL